MALSHRMPPILLRCRVYHVIVSVINVFYVGLFVTIFD